MNLLISEETERMEAKKKLKVILFFLSQIKWLCRLHLSVTLIYLPPQLSRWLELAHVLRSTDSDIQKLCLFLVGVRFDFVFWVHETGLFYL